MISGSYAIYPRMNYLRTRFHSSGRLPVVLLGTLVSLALAGSAIFALGGFTATITNTADSTASGTILLSEQQGATTCLSTAAASITTNSNTCATINLFGGATNLVPGNSNNLTVKFQNIGTNGASTFTVGAGGCSAVANAATSPYSGSDIGGFCSKIDVTIENDTGAATCLYPGGVGACPALSNVDSLTTLTAASPLSLGALASAATDTFKVSVELDPSATNADQGLAASENLTWTLSQ